MADRNQIGRKSVDFFNTYVAERGVRNADLAPAGEMAAYSKAGAPEACPRAIQSTKSLRARPSTGLAGRNTVLASDASSVKGCVPFLFLTARRAQCRE